MDRPNKDLFTTSVFWKLCEQFGPSIVSLVLSIILARLLSVEDYGIIAIAMVFVAFCDILVQNGFCTSLIQNKDAQLKDYYVAMTLSFFVAVVLYVIIFFCAPLIAAYYQQSSLTDILRILGLLVFLNGIAAVLNAYITKAFRFKLMFIVHMISSVASGIIGVVFAYLGYGAWALVIQRLVMQVIFIVILSILLKWNYRPRFDKQSAKQMLGYGIKILGGSMVAFISDNTYSLVVGRKYSTDDVGYISKADQLPTSSILVASNSLAGVLLPTISSIQEDKTAVQSALRRVIRIETYAIFPMVVGLFFVANPLITVMFTEKFIACAPILQALCLFYLTVPTLLACSSVIKGIGKSRLYMWSEIIKMVVTISSVLILTVLFTIELKWLVLVKGIISLLMCLWTLIFTKKYFGYGILKHCADILPALLLSAVMGLAIWGISFALVSLPSILVLIIEVVLGVAVYVGLSILVKNKSFFEILDIIKSLAGKVLHGKKREVQTQEGATAENTTQNVTGDDNEPDNKDDNE